jgi:ferredoxin
MTHLVSFGQPGYPPIRLPHGANLSEHLTVQNSPVLFGCRTGLCGTCRSVVRGDLPPAGAEEREVLEIGEPFHAEARLLCQVPLVADLVVVDVLGPG